MLDFQIRNFFVCAPLQKKQLDHKKSSSSPAVKMLSDKVTVRITHSLRKYTSITDHMTLMQNSSLRCEPADVRPGYGWLRSGADRRASFMVSVSGLVSVSSQLSILHMLSSVMDPPPHPPPSYIVSLGLFLLCQLPAGGPVRLKPSAVRDDSRGSSRRTRGCGGVKAARLFLQIF